ncbi:MAG: DUF349 domain-containing protein [Deltaproteobacteria bacterium]
MKKSKWLHSDPAVRLKAIEGIDPSQTESLGQIVLTDENSSVRIAAINKLEDLAWLEKIADQSSDHRIVQLAQRKNEEKRLVLLQAEGELDIHLQHLARINSTAMLIRLACASFHVLVRLRCIERLSEQQDLEQVAMGHCGKKVAEMLIKRLNNPEILSRLSINGGSRLVRRLCEQKLAGLRNSDTAGATERIERRLRQIADSAERLSTSLEWDLSQQRLNQLKIELESLAGDQHRQFTKRFYEAAARFDRRQADYLLDQERLQLREKEVRKLKAQFAEILLQIQQFSPAGGDSCSSSVLRSLCSQGEEQLEKLPGTIKKELQFQLAEACRQFDEKMARFELEHQKAVEYEARFNERRESIQDPVLLFKELRSHLKLIEDENWQYFVPIALKEKILKEKNLHTDLLNQVLVDKQRQQELLSEKLSRLTAEIGELRKAEDMAATLPRFREIDALCKAAESSSSDYPPELMKQYRAERARYLVRQRDFLALEEWHLWANRNIKEKLIKEAEELEAIDDSANVFAMLKQLQERWKQIGSTGARNDTQLWLRFHAQCERLFESCLPYLEEVEKRRQIEVERFNAIVEEAKTVSGSDSWQATARQFQAWQKEIKELTEVPAPIKHDLFLLFRKEANSFFESRRLNRNQIARKEQKNCQLKEDICQQAEKFAAAPEPGHAAAFRRLQKQWREITPVSRKKEQKFWQRFRRACDQFFHWLDEDRQNNLTQKQLLIEKANALVSQAETIDDFRSLAEEMADLQKQWQETGPVPKSENQRVWELFREQVGRFYTIRQQSLAALHDEKLNNQRRKEEILEQIERLASAIKDKEATERVKALQKQFYTIGPSPKGEDQRLRGELQSLCDNFFKGRSNYFARLRKNREEILREKEALIFELQQLVNYAPKRTKIKGPRTLDLAAQLKLALESNFAMADQGDQGIMHRRN